MNNNLKAHRKVHGKTQKEMAAHLGVSESVYSRYESGERDPKMSNWIEIADYFNVTLDELVGREK